MSVDGTESEKRLLRILVVDDDPVDRLYCTTCLKRSEEQEYDISEADSGASTLSALESDTFDCMLLDQNLPDATGIELLQQMTEKSLLGGMAVIILTGQDTVEVAAQALRGGAADYVQKKSVSTDSLVRAISNATEKVRLEQAIFQEREILAQKNHELLAKHREIQQFYHQVSHELRTPLTSLREFVSIVFDGLAEDHDEQQEYLTYAMEGCDRLSSLVEDLIDATRVESGKMRLREDWVSAERIFELLERSTAVLARDAEVDVCYELADDLPEMWADVERMLQVLTIFMTNAIKFTGENGKVTVAATAVDRDDQQMVRLSIRDTGCGISVDHQEDVFSRLFQVEQIEHEASTGLGLGLSIAKQIVELHEGEIGVESEVDQGSEFYVCIRTTDSGADVQGDELDEFSSAA